MELIHQCTGIKIARRNEITNKVCNACRDVLIKFNELREICLISDKILRHLHRRIDELKSLQYSDTLPLQKEDFDGEIENDDTKQQEKFILTETKAATIKLPENTVKLDEESNVPELDESNWVISPAHADLFKTYQGDKTTKQFCCGCIPSQEFISSEELKAHCDKQHKKYRVSDGSIRPFECSICFQRFLTQSLLKHHQARPYRKRSYICGSCGSAYLTNSALKRHEKMCTVVDKNYTCEECGKKFRQAVTLNNHRKLHQANKTFSCPVCSKTFKQKFEITIHMVTHTGEQPFPCDQCPARFKRKQALKNHQHRHLNPRPFKCESCDEWFSNPTARKFHRLTIHEGLDPFRCDQCGVSYGRRLRLTQHIMRVHKEVVQ